MTARAYARTLLLLTLASCDVAEGVAEGAQHPFGLSGGDTPGAGEHRRTRVSVDELAPGTPVGTGTAMTGGRRDTLRTPVPSTPSNSPIILRPPSTIGHPPPPRPQLDLADDARTALAYQFNSPIYQYPTGKTVIGFARRGRRLPITRWIEGSGCNGGNWYELAQGGYVCNRLGFNPSADAELSEEVFTPQPEIDEPLPFLYSKINEADTPFYWRVPTAAEEAEASVPGSEPEPVKRRSEGATLAALDKKVVRDDGAVFWRTVHGHFLAEGAITVKPMPTMVGEAIESEEQFPIGFVWKDAPLLDRETGAEIGEALKFSRFQATGGQIIDDVAYVEMEYGLVPRAAVRIARVVPRPDRIPEGEQWVHIDLDEQILVAYEDDRPVRATLVSTGKKGYEPPLGVFRVAKKYATKTMAGSDVVDGSYEVDQVPWIMYYWGAYALHGAYWHDGFGEVRSHGCTNIPPVDAQWLFRWAQPELPAGWVSKVGLKGPWLYFSRWTLASNG